MKDRPSLNLTTVDIPDQTFITIAVRIVVSHGVTISGHNDSFKYRCLNLVRSIVLPLYLGLRTYETVSLY